MDYRLSNVKRIESSFNTAEKKLDKVVSGLQGDYQEFTKKNPFYEKVGHGQIVMSIILDVVVCVLLIYFRGLMLPGIGADLSMENFARYLLAGQNDSILPSILTLLLVALLLFCLYRTGVQIYSKRVEKYGTEVSKIREEINSRLDGGQAAKLRKEMIQAAEKNQEYTVESKNDIGERIRTLQKNFDEVNQKADHVRKYVNFGIAAVAMLTLVIYLLAKVKADITVDKVNGFALALLYLCVAAMIHMIQFSSGQYMLKFGKPVAIAMAAVYGLILSVALKGEYDVTAIVIPDAEAAGWNKAYIFLPAVQVIRIILTVLVSHYGLEKEKWRNGFSVKMSYGSKDNGNKMTLFRRGGLALFLLLVLCTLMAAQAPDEMTLLVLCSFLWYASNSVLKPRGSYLYAFWGPKRAWANELVTVGMVLTSCIGARGSMGLEELIAVGIIAALTLLIAGIATWINNHIY